MDFFFFFCKIDQLKPSIIFMYFVTFWIKNCSADALPYVSSKIIDLLLITYKLKYIYIYIVKLCAYVFEKKKEKDKV